MLRLAGEGAGGAVVRRRVPLAELEGPDDEDLAAVLAVLTERRLVTASVTTVEVAHEALLREWPRLRRWLDEDAEGRRIHRHLARAARDWAERGRDPGELYRGPRLAVALEWRAGHDDELNPTERDFLAAGRSAHERAHRRRRMVLAAVAGLLALTVAGGLVALHQRGAAQREAVAAEAQRIGLEAQTDPDLARSLLLARQGVALADSVATRSDLLAALLRAPAAVTVIPGTGAALSDLDVSPDGRTLALGDVHGDVRFVDALTGRPVGRPYLPGGTITMVRFSPDGTRMAVTGYDHTGFHFLDLLDARTHRRLTHLATGFESPIQTSGLLDVRALAFSPDSHTLMAEIHGASRPHPNQRYLERWETRTGRPLGQPQPLTSNQSIEPALIGLTAGATQIVTSSAADGIVVRDAATLRPLRTFPFAGAVPVAAVSADGRQAAFGLRDGRLLLLDLRTGRERILVHGSAPISAMRFTPDSTRLITADSGGPPVVWDARHAVVLETLAGLDGVEALGIAPDGTTVYGAGGDGTVVGWDLSGARGFGPALLVRGGASAILPASPSGRRFVVADRRGYVDLFDGGTVSRRIGVPGLSAIAVTPDGTVLAAGDRSGAVRFIDLHTFRPLGPPQPAHVGRVVSLAFSADGRWLASSGDDYALYAWDARRQRTVKLIPGAPEDSGATAPHGLSISPDGHRLAAAVGQPDGSGELDIYSLPQLTLITKAHVTFGGQTQFSRDGRRLFYRDDAGQVWILDTRTWKPLGLPLPGQPNPGAFALSPDDHTLVTTSTDGTAQLWDVASGRPLGTELAGGGAGAAFVDGGTGLVTMDATGRGALWDLRPQSWEQRACAIAGRRLTRTEWQDALPERPYAPAC
jgi:WD40 repeat protein